MFTRAIFFCSIAVILLAGCASIDGDGAAIKAQEPLEPQAVLKFTDVPVPANFKPILKESYSFETAGVRVGMLKYQGNSTADRVVNFYKEQMPAANWELINIVEYGDRLLNFERDDETCTITVRPKGKSAIITIALGPKSQIAARKSDRPLK